ncbi:hypothetical protein ADIAG_00455 [Paeniglutamicibacter gangotriensis Lz1y]|uniref:Uncharacterized protein n=1 Tax=Paeniglutamicibacter gangotriensis Lz1y TaxID=1276920 RepID=M7MVH9_9MICC|nr:hypothetical protein ADIAG_00455 [Paeniglutamicibacter gangotriensis Lz1y]
MVAGWSTTNSSVSCLARDLIRVLSLASSCGRDVFRSFLPTLFRATAWWLDLPTSTPMKTSMDSWFWIMEHLIRKAIWPWQRMKRSWLVLIGPQFLKGRGTPEAGCQNGPK